MPEVCAELSEDPLTADLDRLASWCPAVPDEGEAEQRVLAPTIGWGRTGSVQLRIRGRPGPASRGLEPCPSSVSVSGLASSSPEPTGDNHPVGAGSELGCDREKHPHGVALTRFSISASTGASAPPFRPTNTRTSGSVAPMGVQDRYKIGFVADQVHTGCRVWLG